VSWTLPFDVLRLGLASVGRNISRSLKLLCLKRNIGNLSAIQEKIGYLLRQRGNERFVGNPEVIQRFNFLIDPVPDRLRRSRMSRCIVESWRRFGTDSCSWFTFLNFGYRVPHLITALPVG
jgi:hypothetical protein